MLAALRGAQAPWVEPVEPAVAGGRAAAAVAGVAAAAVLLHFLSTANVAVVALLGCWSFHGFSSLRKRPELRTRALACIMLLRSGVRPHCNGHRRGWW